jgi:protein AroM
MVNIGLITIGQSPRHDILLDWKFAPNQIENYSSMAKLIPPKDSFIPDNIIFYHAGALDDFTEKNLHEIEPDTNEHAMVSRLRDGSWQKISHKKIQPIIIEIIKKLSEINCEAVVILCTGDFSYINFNGLILESGKICKSLIESILNSDDTLCVFSPLSNENQNKLKKGFSNRFNRNIIQAYSNPYELPEENIIPIVNKLKKIDFNSVYLNCLGYSYKHKNIVESTLKKPVILPRSVLAWTLSDLFSTV